MVKYKPLPKIHYQDITDYNDIVQSRYNGDDTLHLDFIIKDYPAFVCQNAELFSLLLRIHKTDKNIRQLRYDLPGVALKQFTRKCLVDELVLTNDIEGINSTRREINEALDNIVTSKTKKRFDGLVRQYVMLHSNSKLELKTCQDIRKIYDDLVLQEVIEEDPADAPDGQIFRKESVSIDSPSQKEIHRGIMPENAIIVNMNKALSFLNAPEYDLLVRISVFHYFLGYIHPFYNGNGRLSRFISSYMLSQELDPLISYRLSYTIKANIKQYYDAFKICNDSKSRGDLTPFVLSFLEIIAESMEQLEKALLRRSIDLFNCMDYAQKDNVLSDKKLIELVYLLVQAGLFSEYGISTQELCSNSSMSYTTLKKRFAEIEKQKLLTSQKIGKERYYKLDVSKILK